MQGPLTGGLPHLPDAPDPALHHHPARAPGPHPARPRGEELPAAGEGPAGGPLPADARRGVRDREHQEESGNREDDCRGLRHPSGREPGVRQAGNLAAGPGGETQDRGPGEALRGEAGAGGHQAVLPVQQPPPHHYQDSRWQVRLKYFLTSDC